MLDLRFNRFVTLIENQVPCTVTAYDDDGDLYPVNGQFFVKSAKIDFLGKIVNNIDLRLMPDSDSDNTQIVILDNAWVSSLEFDGIKFTIMELLSGYKP